MATWWGARPLLFKLMIGFGAVVLLSGVALGSTVLGVFAMNAQQAYTSQHLLPARSAGTQAMLLLRQFDSDTSQAVMDHTPAAKDDVANVRADRDKLASTVAQARGLALDGTMTQALDAFDKATLGPQGFVTAENAALELRQAGHFDEANKAMVAADMTEAQKALDGYLGDVSERVAAGEESSRRTAGTVVGIGIIGGLAAIGLGLLVAFLLARSIAGSIKATTAALDTVVTADFADLSRALEQLAAGDLTASFSSARQPLAVRGDDEVTALVRTYNALAQGLAATANQFSSATGTLREVMRQVSNAAQVTADAASDVSLSTMQSNSAVDEMANTTRSLADGSRNQADEVRTSGAAVEELSRSARQIATGANSQAHSLGETADAVRGLDAEILGTVELSTGLTATVASSMAQASAGSDAVGQTQGAMIQIQSESKRAVEAIRSLAERSTAVEAIISTIEDIADQTNLLALNAAIEAARAGENGRGFAVVADEVRKLAERAASSTREIGGILSGIRKETEAAETAIITSATSTEKGLELASSASRSLSALSLAIGEQERVAQSLAARADAMRNVSQTVTKSVASVSAVVGENATASTEMSTTTELIAGAMMTVSNGTNEQSAAAQELAAACTQLSDQMHHIKSTASMLQTESTKLTELISGFQLGAETGPPASHDSSQRPLTGAGR